MYITFIAQLESTTNNTSNYSSHREVSCLCSLWYFHSFYLQSPANEKYPTLKIALIIFIPNIVLSFLTSFSAYDQASLSNMCSSQNTHGVTSWAWCAFLYAYLAKSQQYPSDIRSVTWYHRISAEDSRHGFWFVDYIIRYSKQQKLRRLRKKLSSVWRKQVVNTEWWQHAMCDISCCKNWIIEYWTVCIGNHTVSSSIWN